MVKWRIPATVIALFPVFGSEKVGAVRRLSEPCAFALHSHQTSEQRSPHLNGCLHSSDGDANCNDRNGRNAAALRAKFPIRPPSDTLPAHARHPTPDPREPRPSPDPVGNRGRGASRLPTRGSPDP
jgi:hypothetical protein